jgi:kynurenine formamidase
VPLSAELQALAERVSNWGRWGVDDRRGTLNLIDDAAVARGLAAARTGVTFSLTLPFDEDGPQLGFIEGRTNPQRTMNQINHSLSGDPADFTTSDDSVAMGIQASTHWDALAHVGYDGVLYNGVPMSTTTEAGSTELGIERVGALVSRGILLDIPRVHGVDHFDDGYQISGDDLEAARVQGGVDVLPGDVLCVRTGAMHWLQVGDKVHYSYPTAGIATTSIEWIRSHDVGAVATDSIVFECYPPEDPAVMLPVHMILIRDVGLTQGQNFVLDPLAAHCAATGQHDFLLVATPLPFTRAVGGPVAPTAIL